MDASEIETTVRTWLGKASIDPKTGLPPDAKVSVSARYVSTFGRADPEPPKRGDGMDIWTITATLYFPDDSNTWELPNDLGLAVAEVLEPLEQSLSADPQIGGPAGLRVEWRGTEGSEPVQRPDSPPNYPWAVDVHLSAHHMA